MKNNRKIAVVGGGPGALFLYKHLIGTSKNDLSVFIFEKTDTLGAGMPYSQLGANEEHVTNVSGNETPELVTEMTEWIKTVPRKTLDQFCINPDKFHEYKVVPRLLFGLYLTAQFHMLLNRGREKHIQTTVYLNTNVTDVEKDSSGKFTVKTDGQNFPEMDEVIICIGHNWPKKHEGKTDGYFDSPYPPSKLAHTFNHAIAIKGSSLTAIDALRTLSRSNGYYKKSGHNRLKFILSPKSPDFRVVMHSRDGLLPAVRFHLDDPHLEPENELTDTDIENNKNENEGFLSLDYVFQHSFIKPFEEKDPEFFERIHKMSIEDFVEVMMGYREGMEPFELLNAEYLEAEKSIKYRESVHWKEMLAILSFVMNYPAKHFSAEDMQRLKKVLQPLISIVIAFAPQESVEEMLALKQAGVLSIVDVGDSSSVEAGESGGAVYHYTDEAGVKQSSYFKTYIDCSGQPHLSYRDLPFKSLTEKGEVKAARLEFKDAAEGKKAMKEDDNQVERGQAGEYFLKVPGITINDHFQIIDDKGNLNRHLYMMAVPYIGGYNPDYSGLDFSETASKLIVESLYNPVNAQKDA